MLGYLFGNRMYDPVIVQAPAPSPTMAASRGDLMALEHRIDSLELACAALWTLLKQVNGFTDEQLKGIIHQIDASDGTIDGKMTPRGVGVCPTCGHKLLSRSVAKCLWCGAPLTAEPFNQGGSGSSPTR